jgi:hypothetical protein
MHTKCRDLYFFVRRFTRQTLALFVWYLINVALLVYSYGLNPYLDLLLVLTFAGLCVSIANLAHLRRLRSESLAPHMSGRGYLVPAPWLTISEDEIITSNWQY